MAKQKTLTLSVNQPIDLDITLNSGQAFRWHKKNDWFYGTIQDILVGIRHENSSLSILYNESLEPSQQNNLKHSVKSYFRLDDNLESIYEQISTDDIIIQAINRYRGLRILRQEPWECLVSFICSANSNISRNSTVLQSLAREYGDPLRLGDHTDYTFPKPERLASLGEFPLRKLGLGFRAKYIAAASSMIASGDVCLSDLLDMPYSEAKENLIKFSGVGEKVADCVLLFSLDKMEACPIDRWIRRAFENWYPVEENLNYNKLSLWAFEKWGAYAGYAQQYLFHQIRLNSRTDSED